MIICNESRVELIDSMGSDLSVVNAARVSFRKRSESLDARDIKLISYLARHNHWTVFGHCSLSFRIAAPIFVARQLGKHQVGLVWNEVSRRYVDAEPEFFVPAVWRTRAENVKQGSGDPAGSYEERLADVLLLETTEKALESYNKLLERGICPEQARMILPQNMMTEWIWTGSLMAFIRVCKLRLDPHSQQETREIAEKIKTHLEVLFPESTKALLQT